MGHNLNAGGKENAMEDSGETTAGCWGRLTETTPKEAKHDSEYWNTKEIHTKEIIATQPGRGNVCSSSKSCGDYY